jgi:hypothetical protein
LPFPKFHWQGCRLEAGQTWGSVRLAALVRDEVRGDLRLSPRVQNRDRVRSSYPQAQFTSYIPQALVVRWDRDGTAEATAETHLGDQGGLSLGKLWKRQSPTELAFLPNALAIEGFMVRHFKGPDVAWLDYQRAVRRGSLGVRAERSVPGWYLKGMAEALALFEFAPNQVGTALFLDEELIGCFITPHPEDYAQLHESLLCDHFADYLIHYGYLRYAKRQDLPLNAAAIVDLDSLSREFARAKAAESAKEVYRLGAIEGRELETQTVYRTDRFTLERFVTQLQGADNFAGEAIVREDGTLEYLKLFRLSRGQSRRLHLLSTLARHGWNFDQAAPDLGVQSREDVARSFVEADLGYLLNPGIWGHLLPKSGHP